MEPTLTLTRDTISSTLVRWALVMRKEMPAAIREGGRRVHRYVVAITPPANAGSGALTGPADAFRAGKAKIHRDLSRVLAPRTLKHKRKERFPDVEATYRARAHLRSGIGVRVSRGAIAYVDRAKFLALEQKKFARVGRLAAGWNAGSQVLDLPSAAFIARHGSANGAAVTNFTGPKMGVRVTNFAPGYSGAVRSDLARRIPYALVYVERGLRANIDHVVMKGASDVGIRAVRSFPSFIAAA